MNSSRRGTGPHRAVVAAVAGLLAILAAEVSHAAGTEFPFDRLLMLDAAPMPPSKRKPSVTIAADGAMAIDLWCKSVGGRAEITEDTIKMMPAPMPEALPDVMSYGQCTPERMRADDDLLNALSQVDAWWRQDSAVVFSGPATLRFYPPTN